MPLSKLKRDAYLHFMGIQPWGERLPIQKQVVVSVSPNIGAPLSPTVKDIAPQRMTAPTIIKELTLSTTAFMPAIEAVRFNLLFLVFSDLLIISELPHEHKQLSSEQGRLLKSMRFSLGYPAGDPLQTTVMVWPLVENSKIDQGEIAAREAVKAQLKKQMDKYQSKYVVLMGVAACRYVLGEDISFERVRGQMIANEQLCAVVTYGVNELLKVPALKSAAWQDLQVVRPLSK